MQTSDILEPSGYSLPSYIDILELIDIQITDTLIHRHFRINRRTDTLIHRHFSIDRHTETFIHTV